MRAWRRPGDGGGAVPFLAGGRAGALAVDFFFLLSGFVIAHA
jgi:peptidoglycan/LPS O-acetylase OafA/YrhL